MKKLLLTLALIVSVLTLSAQKYTVTEKATGNVVENGANYYMYGEGSFKELIAEFIVTANEPVNLIGEKEEIQVVENTVNMLCLGSCYSPTVYVSPVVPFTTGHSEDFAMHYMAMGEISDVAGMEQIMKYHLYEEGDPDNKFTVNVTFKFSLEGIEDNSSVETFSNAYPVPAKDVVNFDYNFTSSKNAEIAIYNMMGQEVMRNEINGIQGKASVNVSNLADGVYFYSLIVDGKTEKSNKLIIKK
ncbi:MAG: T9SS type A sorting domain-containing protein [Bacteroidales bacterium]|nr:T9SS type A sorting domain-containing protein [Bacteroidales bacterium]